MNVSVILTPNFEKEAKKLIKKHRSLKSELENLASNLEENPRMGIMIKENVYKIRLAVKSKGKGKRGGMRIITYVEVELIENNDKIEVYLLSIYDKSDRGNISDKLLAILIKEIQKEIENLNSETEEE